MKKLIALAAVLLAQGPQTTCGDGVCDASDVIDCPTNP